MFKIIFIITLISFLYKFINSKADYQDAKRINDQFNKWYIDSTDNPKPSNATFEKLYAKRTGNNQSALTVYKENRVAVISQQVDLIGSFPSTHPQLVQQELAVLDQLESFYEEKYKEVFSFKYWFNFLVFLPSNIFNYFNIEEFTSLKRIINLIYWIAAPVWAVYHSQITKIVKEFFSSLS